MRKPKILVLDEATASIDQETDAFIQKMIRTRFTTCTMLTIAHRLDTIIDSDRIIIMNKGKLEEYDKPNLLLNSPGKYSLFKELWERHTSESSK